MAGIRRRAASEVLRHHGRGPSRPRRLHRSVAPLPGRRRFHPREGDVMMTTTHPLADGYLKRLDRASRALPRYQREELLTDVRTHLEAGLSPDATEADVRNLLDELGPPEEIVAPAVPESPSVRRGAREVFALLLLVTGFPPVIGWLV